MTAKRTQSIAACCGLAALLALGLKPTDALAQQAPRDAVELAVDDAVARLLSDVSRLPLGQQLTVGDLLAATDSHDELVKTLRRARMIGGARWLDDGLVEVRLDISGRRFSDAVVQIAAANPGKSPISAELLARQASAWAGQTFTATGLSGVPRPMPLTVPAVVTEPAQYSHQNEPWPTDLIELQKAQPAATTRALPLGVSVAAGVAHAQQVVLPSVPPAWAAASLSATGQSTRGIGHAATTGPAGVMTPAETAESAPTGNSSPAVNSGPTANSAPTLSSGPAEAPGALAESSQAALAARTAASTQAQSSAPRDKLRVLHAADAEARAALREQIESLRLLADGPTLGELSEVDPRWADVIDAAVDRAKPMTETYQPDGSAEVALSTPGALLWRDIEVAFRPMP